MIDQLEPDQEHIAAKAGGSLMLVTAVEPWIGYDKVVNVVKLALAEHLSLKQVVESLGYVDRWVVPATMTEPGGSLPGGGC